MAKITKYVSDLTLRLGPITTTGGLTGVRMSAKKASKPQFKSVSPEGQPVKQVYQDDSGNIFQKAELGKAIETKETPDAEPTLVQVDVQAIEEAKASSLPKNVVNLTVHPAAQVDRELYPSEANGYVFTPDDNDPVDLAWYQLLVRLVSDKSNAYLSVARVRGNDEGLFRLSTWNNRLVLQRVLYPHEVNEYEELPTINVDSATFEKAEAMVTKLVQPFDPDEYSNNVTERLAAMGQAFVTGEYEVSVPMPVEEVAVDLAAALDAFDVMS